MAITRMATIIEAAPALMWARRLGWFVAIWAASVTALGLVATALRWAIAP